MGNSTSTNRVDDKQRKRAQIGQQIIENDQSPSLINDRMNNRCSLDVELVQQNYNYSSPNMSPQAQSDIEMQQAELQKRFINTKNIEIQLLASTWYRDSHGLYDYEEAQKLTINQFRLRSNFLFKRDNDNILHTSYMDFQSMRYEQQLLQEQQKDDYKKIAAACFFKDNNYWMYHRDVIDNSEDEKTNPGDKLWLVMRLMGRDKNHGFKPDNGYKLNIGDTIKFGRVRYKVVMLQNQTDGFQEFSLLDRFQKHQFIQQQIRDGILKKFDQKLGRNRKNSQSNRSNQGNTTQFPNSPSPRNGIDSIGMNSGNLPRFQSQCTQFDQNFEDQRDSFYGHDEDEESESQQDEYGSMVDSQSRGEGDMESCEDETDSEEMNSRRDPVIDEIEELATQQQIDFRASAANQSMVSNPNMTAGSKNSLIPNFGLGRFNSVLPSDAINMNQNKNASNDFSMSGTRQQSLGPGDNMLNIPDDGGSATRTRARRLSNGGFENTLEDEQNNQTREQQVLMGRTGTFLFGQNSGLQSNIGASYVSAGGSTGQVLVRDNNEMMDSQSLAHNINLEATQAALFESANEEREFQRKLKKRLKKNQKQKQKLKQKLANQAKIVEGKVCRICLGEENEKTDPLISPCKCAGTMSHIHLECLREWLNSKRSRKESAYVKTYCWKALECELCKVRFPGQVFPDGTIVSDGLKLSYKQIKKMGKPIEILDFERPEQDFIVLESVTLQNIRIIHVITMNEKQYIKVGRGHETDIRVTDISVSRFHAKINRSLTTGEYFVEDNKSKFGTLVQVRKPFRLEKNKNNYLQMGRTMLQIRIEDEDLVQTSYKSDTSSMCQALLCCKKRQKKVEYLNEPCFEFYPHEWDPLPQDNLDETGPNPKDSGTQGIEQTRDEDQPSAAGQLNQSALQNENIQNREESPQLNFTQQQEENLPAENPIMLQPVEQIPNRGQEESKVIDVGFQGHGVDPSLMNSQNENHRGSNNQFGDAQPPPQGEATVRVSAQNFLQMQALYLDQENQNHNDNQLREEEKNEVIGQRGNSKMDSKLEDNDQSNANRIVSEELKMMNEDNNRQPLNENDEADGGNGEFTDSKNAIIQQSEEQNQSKTGIKNYEDSKNDPKSAMNISQDIRSQLEESPQMYNKKGPSNVLMGLETGLNTKNSSKIQSLPFKGQVDTSSNMNDASMLGITPTQQNNAEIIGDGLKVVNDTSKEQTHRTDNQMMVITPRMGIQNTQEQVIDNSPMATPLASAGPFSMAGSSVPQQNQTSQMEGAQNQSSLLQNDNTGDYQ